MFVSAYRLASDICHLFVCVKYIHRTMPVRRSSSNGGSFKLSRKPRVAVGSSKGIGDGFRTPRSKDSDAGKGQRKVRFLMEDSKGSSSGARAGEAKKWSRNSQSRENGRDAVPYYNGNGKSSDTRGRGRRDSKMKGGSEGRDSTVDGKLGWKRKRIGAETGTVDQAMFGGDDKKSRSEWKKNALNSFLDNDKKPSRRKDNEFKNSSRGKLVTERGKFRGSESLDKRSRNRNTGGVDKPKFVTVGNGSKISDRSKAPLATQKELNQRENGVGSVEKPLIKRVQRKKLLVTDSDLAGERPKKKKKRGIRIDPYDTSNKRLDDSISDKGQYPYLRMMYHSMI